MKVVILAGGLGSRLSEETELKPKPMVEIGGKPILWHIMKIYSYYGFNDFVILLGYKGYVIKEYFANYYMHQSDITINLKYNETQILNNHSEPWRISLIDTGMDSMTGGRIKRIKDYINKETFLLTYGDGVSNINISNLVSFHQANKKLLTVSSVQPEGRWGALEINDQNEVISFQEKQKGDGQWVNAGFFVCEPEIMDYIEGDSTIFEKGPLERLAKDKQLVTYKHSGFWSPMDTIKDKKVLDQLIYSKKAPWMLWENAAGKINGKKSIQTVNA
ncbi:glucose-1-phosphate cytidylyltransferase [uncultured Draconibacterium sp.]|uniref:glucose-1-phosphate cytidylyltransferase n=1 Tax=uncultured Draconibacterium sp. TaxID=1573823 RepID=UPI0029C05E7D|nr:glucose-1-phosphate cytidylyltransferase [uncultured Draconibacterium sp.]